MTQQVTANALLRALAGTGSAPAMSVGPSMVAGASFAELLSRFGPGADANRQALTVADDAGLMLDPVLASLLTAAAEKAESEGVRTALVLTGGDSLILDVQTRTVLGRASQDAGVHKGIDGVIDFRPSGDRPAASHVGPAGVVHNRDLLAVLSGLAGRSAAGT